MTEKQSQLNCVMCQLCLHSQKVSGYEPDLNTYVRD
jgi:hypothetical protein